MNWEGCERKLSWPVFKISSWCLAGVMKEKHEKLKKNS
jgi:hypothetical protein